MRLFVALDLPEPLVEAIGALQRTIKGLDSSDMRFVDPDKLHLTLQFLGDIDEEKLPEVEHALEVVTCKPFRVCLSTLGVLPNQKHIRIIYVDLIGRELDNLAGQIKTTLTPFLEEEHQAQHFLSHVTIARVKSIEHHDAFLKAMGKIKVPEVCFMVRRFALKQSELSSGAEHTIVKEYKF